MTDRRIISTKPQAQHQRLKIYLRSGNQIMIDGVLDWDIEVSSVTSRITRLKVDQDPDPRFARLLVQTLDLSQIEAVLLLPEDGARRTAREGE